MPTTLTFKDIIDLPLWRPLANAQTAHGTATSLFGDLRNNEDRHPLLFDLLSATVLDAYHIKNDEWLSCASPALTGTFGAGAGGVFAPSHGPRGTLSTGNTAATVVLSTALPAAVGINQLANRGDGRPFKIRIIGNSAGGSGKIEERYIIGNTGGTTPTLRLGNADGTANNLSFTPAVGDTYEIISGRAYLLSASTLAAGMWKYYDVATNSFSGNLATTNLPATVNTDDSFVALDELYVPYNRNPGEGFLIGAGTYNGGALGCLTATASAAGTLTGQATAGDAAVLTNEYRNFQIRIVEDTATPTAVGQRRIIASHTAGASPVYTLASNWTVTPSATCKFVIENNNYILLWSSASVNTHSYASYAVAGGQGADSWSTATFAARGTAMGAGCMSAQSFGLALDADKNARFSNIFSFRGGNVNTLDILDIAGGATGLWTNGATYGGQNMAFTTGSCCAYDGVTQAGKYLYISRNGGQRFYRFDMQNRMLEPWASLRIAQGTAAVGEKLATIPFIDGTTKLAFLITGRQGNLEHYQVALSR